ncbi:unnamed protein product [Auanema sp. JU1783]|nr:unnamed protein product [Auanema sp. JU1783]
MINRIPLPIDDVEQQIIEILTESESSIIIGETGSGKSTQIPQLCARAGLLSEGRVGITQPRRVAAISLAHRVAEEVGSTVGEKVGYHVRFEKMYNDNTEICYMTDGILLREAMQDPYLSEYSVILIDEAHERSLHTDIMLSVLRICQRQRKEKGANPLKIVIMSATMQADLFSKYFNNAPIYVIKGRTFSVDVYHANSIDPKSADYVYNAIICIKDIHATEPLTDDVLVFLTGREEIEMAARKLRELNMELTNKLFPVPLFAALTGAAQMKAFKPAPEGQRKVVLATNIAETSLTIPGIKIVVDSGKVKSRSFTAKTKIDVLKVHDISQAQAVQRSGRAGREAPGKCYRLYPESHYDQMEATSIPEILRSNLSAVILELLSMGLKRPRNLKWIEPPSEDSILAAEKELLALGAIKLHKKITKLTEEGRKMSRFPLDPEQAKVLLYAAELDCLEEALSVVSMMSIESVFEFDCKGTPEEIERARNRFTTNEGDHLTFLNVYQAFSQEKRKNKGKLKEWCSANFLSLKNLTTAAKIRKQLREICSGEKLQVKSCGANRDKLRQALACGLFMNVCEYNRQDDRYKLIIRPATTIKIHPASTLSRSKPTHIVFSDLVKTTDLYARSITIIDSEWVRPVLEKYKITQ